MYCIKKNVFFFNPCDLDEQVHKTFVLKFVKFLYFIEYPMLVNNLSIVYENVQVKIGHVFNFLIYSTNAIMKTTKPKKKMCQLDSELCYNAGHRLTSKIKLVF